MAIPLYTTGSLSPTFVPAPPVGVAVKLPSAFALLTKGTLSPINGLELVVGTRFQVLFHSPPGVLFTFPSRYWFTIGH